MFHIVLYQPEIPPNTGNIIRLCANTGCALHLVKPLGFELEDKKLRRAGLDYHEWADVMIHENINECLLNVPNAQRVFAFSTKGKQNYSEVSYQAGDTFLFGPETKGLPRTLLDSLAPECVLRLPMYDHSRSLNLSNTAAIAVYEAWRQLGFHKGK